MCLLFCCVHLWTDLQPDVLELQVVSVWRPLQDARADSQQTRQRQFLLQPYVPPLCQLWTLTAWAAAFGGCAIRAGACGRRGDWQGQDTPAAAAAALHVGPARAALPQ